MSDVRALSSAILACVEARSALETVARLFPAEREKFAAAVCSLGYCEGVMNAGIEFGCPGCPLPPEDPEQLDFPFELDE